VIFEGDIASPDRAITEQLEIFLLQHRTIFENKRVICNFEGVISDRIADNDAKPILCNHYSVPGVLNRGVTPVLCMANNHILDLPGEFESTIDVFNKAGALYCGAGNTAESAASPLIFFEGNKKILLFNACWDFLLYNQNNPSEGVYVAEIDEDKLIIEVRKAKQANPNASIIVFLHWSLDLEILPFPMYRLFSRALVDAGAEVVAGSHSHCVQGGEKYKDGFIVYGLGNFFLPQNVFINGKLIYPDFTAVELAFEWVPETRVATCHWFEYQYSETGHILLHCKSERFEDSEKLKQYSPYQGMTDGEYLEYFKAHRRKRFMIPVYTDHDKKFQNRLFTLFLKNRARFAHLLARMRIIKWQN